MLIKNYLLFVLIGCFGCVTLSCKKDKPPVFKPKIVVYTVAGTNFRLNYIDSKYVFHKDEVFKDNFRLEFKQGPGASIGISIFKATDSDSIFSWRLEMDGKLYANGFSEGGAYMTVPY